MSLIESDAEKREAKTYDIKIILWLRAFAKPYAGFMTLSFIFMIITAAMELSVPYITKVAVDGYVHPRWREARFPSDAASFEARLRRDYPPFIVNLGEGAALIDISAIETEDKTDLEKRGYLSKAKFLAVNPAEFEATEQSEILRVIEKYGGAFKRADGIYYADYEAVSKFDGDDIALLRGDELRAVAELALLLLLALSGVFLFSSLYTYILNYTGQRIMHQMRVEMFSKILSLPQPFFDKNPVGRLTTRVTNDINAINEMYTSVSVQFFKDILVIAGVLGVMFYMNRPLTLFILGITALLGVIAWLFRMRLKTVYRNLRKTVAQLNAFVQESVRGVVLIKLYNKEQENFERFRRVNLENYTANMDQLFAFATFRPIIEFISISTVALIVWYGGLRVLDLNLTLGALIAYLAYIKMLFKPILELAERYNIFQSAIAASENLYDLAHAKSEARPEGRVEGARGEVEFRNVWFSYNGRDWILKNVSFKATPGKTLAFVGLTGSGKTTIVNLILKLYDIERGEILFDGVNIRDLDPEFLRSEISAVFQDVFIFGRNASNGHHSQDGEFNRRLNGSGELFSARGTASSGEKQIQSLKEALSKRAKVLILDEATSHIDAEIELNIREFLRETSSDRTTIIVAHRLSNIKRADEIIVIHRGEVAESGNHAQLLARKGGIYESLYRLQSEVRSAEAPGDEAD
ncbi:MAG: ABC transporter ATP-binding protein [Deltaproteobacteria bacterium]